MRSCVDAFMRRSVIAVRLISYHLLIYPCTDSPPHLLIYSSTHQHSQLSGLLITFAKKPDQGGSDVESNQKPHDDGDQKPQIFPPKRFQAMFDAADQRFFPPAMRSRSHRVTLVSLVSLVSLVPLILNSLFIGHRRTRTKPDVFPLADSGQRKAPVNTSPWLILFLFVPYDY